jgi:hypothetical protein
MSSPTKLNGKKGRPPVMCPHAEDCAAPTMHEAVMTSIDDLSKSVGLLLESHEGMADRHRDLVSRVEQIHAESLDRARTYIESNDQILKALRRVVERIGE